MAEPRSQPAIRRHAERWGMAGLALDLFMVALAVANLSWLLFDSIWAVPELRGLLAHVVPAGWLAAYAPVHENFFRIDLVFISIFLAEFMLRWGLALWNRRYRYWFAFPLLHWYDLLGCIPVAGLRWLRVLRIFAVLIRLQSMGVIDYRQWAIYQWGKAAYDIVMEEISDRVVLRVLSGVQDEIRASGPVERQMLDRVILPRRQEIIHAVRIRLIDVLDRSYAASRDDLHAFLTRAVSGAVRDSREIRLIDRIPIVGGATSQLLSRAITDVVCNVLDELSESLSGQEFEALFDDIGRSVIDGLIAGGDVESRQLGEAINDMLDVVKEQVARRRWLEGPEASSGAP